MMQYEMAKIATLYRSGKSTKEIAHDLGYSDAAVREVIRDLGIGHVHIPMHDRPEQIKKCLNCPKRPDECGDCAASEKSKARKKAYARKYYMEHREAKRRRIFRFCATCGKRFETTADDPLKRVFADYGKSKTLYFCCKECRDASFKRRGRA